MTVAAQVPVGAEAGGRRRIYVQATEARFRRCLSAFNSHEVRKAANLFSKAAKSCRMQSWLTLERSFKDVAFLESAQLEGQRAFAIWSTISAGRCPLFSAQRSLTPEEEQEAAVVHYIVAGRLPQSTIKGIALATATWTCSITAHAIGRLCQRSPNANIDDAILRLHRTLLNAPTSSAEAMIRERFVVPTETGGFVCDANMHVARTSRDLVFHIRGVTFIGQDQIADAQIERSAQLLTPREDRPPMVSTLLLPLHLRRQSVAGTSSASDMKLAS
jgi:hypothetical protein